VPSTHASELRRPGGRPRSLIAAAWLALAAGACAAPPTPTAPGPAATGTVTVLAAASLTEALGDVARAFEAAHPGVHVAPSFAGSQALVAQVMEGVPADLVVLADDRQMARLTAAGRVTTPATVATNHLAVLVPRDNPAGLQAAADVARPGVRLVLAGPDVPAGRYARLALGRLGVLAAAEANVVSLEDDVKGVVGKVLAGEADAGIAYRTDVTPALADRLTRLPLPAAADVVASYSVARILDAPNPRAAAAFRAFLVGDTARTILARHGFGAP
jgi:molybdate transport system substrate-binding protein